MSSADDPSLNDLMSSGGPSDISNEDIREALDHITKEHQKTRDDNRRKYQDIIGKII